MISHGDPLDKLRARVGNIWNSDVWLRDIELDAPGGVDSLDFRGPQFEELTHAFLGST